METIAEGLSDSRAKSETHSEETSEGLSDSLLTTESESEESSEELEWLRKAEAASRLGISERTIENRVNAGKLRKRLRNDGTVEVLVPKPSEDVQVDKALVLLDRYNTAVAQQITPLVERIAAQAETIGELRKESETLRSELERAEERIARLEVPASATIAEATPQEPDRATLDLLTAQAEAMVELHKDLTVLRLQLAKAEGEMMRVAKAAEEKAAPPEVVSPPPPSAPWWAIWRRKAQTA